jgi:hypothetical protein
MTKQFDEDYPVKPTATVRKRNPNKRHKTGFNENQDVLVQRHNRINFKNYLRNVKEQELMDDEMDLNDEEL